MAVQTRSMKAAKAKGKSPKSAKKVKSSGEGVRFPSDFKTKFEKFVKEARNAGSTENIDDLKVRFSTAYVPHLMDKPLIRIEFTGGKSVKQIGTGYSFSSAGGKSVHMKGLACNLR